MTTNRDSGRSAILNAAPAELPDETEGGDSRFEMRPDGLFRRSEERRPWRVCGPFSVASETIDEETQAWGILLRFHDRDQAEQTLVVGRELFAGEGAELRTLLARRGLYVNPSPTARAAMNDYLSSVASPRRARIVSRIGWHRIGDNRVFVLPSEIIGVAADQVLYQPPTREVSVFRQGGDLDGWRDQVAALCVGNTRLTLAVSMAFAGPLLEPLTEDGGGLHLRGASRIGKTTALRVAASVWGGDPLTGAQAYIRQWRSTANATEAVAAGHSDTLIAIDEIGQADPRDVGQTAYLLSAGRGKNRMDRAGGLRPATTFRALFLSSGEVSLADKMAEAGLAVKAGQEVRLIDLSADAGAGFGIFEALHDCPSAMALADRLKLATAQHYGAAGPAFLRYLTDRLRDEPELTSDLRRWAADLVADWVPADGHAAAQVRNVARRFALLAIGGELTTRAGITGWDEGDATAAAATCFQAWLKQRGSIAPREELQAVAQLRDFLGRHGDARFSDWKDAPPPDPAQQVESPAGPPAERFKTMNRAGWRRWTVEEDGTAAWRYFLTGEAMGEALAGLDRPDAHQALIERGFLIPGRDGKAAGSERPPGHKKVRLYQIKGTILGSAEGDA